MCLGIEKKQKKWWWRHDEDQYNTENEKQNTQTVFVVQVAISFSLSVECFRWNACKVYSFALFVCIRRTWRVQVLLKLHWSWIVFGQSELLANGKRSGTFVGRLYSFVGCFFSPVQLLRLLFLCSTQSIVVVVVVVGYKIFFFIRPSKLRITSLRCISFSPFRETSRSFFLTQWFFFLWMFASSLV